MSYYLNTTTQNTMLEELANHIGEDALEAIEEENYGLRIVGDAETIPYIEITIVGQEWRIFKEYADAEQKALDDMMENPEGWRMAVMAGETEDSLKEWTEDGLDVAGCLAGYDGQEIELPSGFSAFRSN